MEGQLYLLEVNRGREVWCSVYSVPLAQDSRIHWVIHLNIGEFDIDMLENDSTSVAADRWKAANLSFVVLMYDSMLFRMYVNQYLTMVGCWL
jgi:hypothetical protein